MTKSNKVKLAQTPAPTKSPQLIFIDKVGIRRLTVHIKRSIEAIGQEYIARPFTSKTCDELQKKIEALIDDLIKHGGCILRFYVSVASDEKDLMWVEISLEPVEEAEGIYIDLEISRKRAKAMISVVKC
jgi:hypothetical protein